MTLGEFRKSTETLPDDTQLVVEAWLDDMPHWAGTESIELFEEKSLVKKEHRLETKTGDDSYYLWNDDFDHEKNMVVIRSKFYEVIIDHEAY